jgi:hypothetical protein
MTHKWEHKWQNVGPGVFWCDRCGSLMDKGSRLFCVPGGGWMESPPDCLVLEDGPDDEPCQCDECRAERNRAI